MMSISSRIEMQNISVKRNLVSSLLQLLRFCMVGGLNTSVDVLVFNRLVRGLPTQKSSSLILYHPLAYMVGAVNRFGWNKLWTFQQRSSATNDQVVRFVLVTSLGIVRNDAFLWLATTILTSLSLNSFLWVNDGSKDCTGEIVARLAAYDRRIHLIKHPVNRGYGAALATGYRTVTKELVFYMDSEGQFDILDLIRVYPLIKSYDALLGYRIDRQDTWMRKLNAWGWKLVLGFVLGVHARAIDCAFKLFRAGFFRMHQLETCGAMMNAEIL